METVIIINPDRFSKQSFPPFLFLCKALLKAQYLVRCLGAKKHSTLPKAENFDFYSPFDSSAKPLLYGVRFVIFSFLKVIKLILAQKCTAIIVFRSCDSLNHYLTSKFFRVPLIFFVDYLPWKQEPSVLKNPQLLLQILGLCLCDKLVVSSDYNAKEIVKKIPFLQKKIVVEKYSPEIYDSVEAANQLRESIISRFNIKAPILILSGAATAEESIRALARFKNLILILQIGEADSDYFIGLAQALGFINRIELVALDADLLELIPAMDLLISPGSGGYILTALSQNIPVLAPNTEEMKEWINSERFLYKTDSVESLIQALSKVLGDQKWKKAGIEECKTLPAADSWGKRTLKLL